MTVRFALVTALLGALSLGSVSGVADVNAAQAVQQNPSAQDPANMQEMMKMHEQMMAGMKAANAKLDALVRDMNAAGGDDDLTVRGRIREGPHRSVRAIAERDEALAERFPDITCPKNTNSHRVCSFCAPRSL